MEKGREGAREMGVGSGHMGTNTLSINSQI